MPENFFILSKKNLPLAVDELIAISKSYDRFARIHSEENLVVIQTKTNYEKIAKRASFVKIAGQVVKKLSAIFLENINLAVIKEAKTFACRILNLSSQKIEKQDIEKSLGILISKFSGANVSLEDPEVVIYLIITNTQSFFGFSKKSNTHRLKRVVSHPHQLDNKLTRTMINLSGLRVGETVCDPFCGTGTTLLEAQSMGINAIGLDFDFKTCKISQKNLEANGLESLVINADYKYLEKIKTEFDGIVTDIPYGKNTKINEDPRETISELMKMISKRKKIAIMCKKGFEDKIEANRHYDIYTHKSLTRTILVR